MLLFMHTEANDDNGWKTMGDEINIRELREERAGWGTSTGSREEMKLRNEKIYELHAGGIPLAELAELYHLSEERIRNIVCEQQRD
jgi:Mor family transcriptional regulator